jgi:hypothetical protein
VRDEGDARPRAIDGISPGEELRILPLQVLVHQIRIEIICGRRAATDFRAAGRHRRVMRQKRLRRDAREIAYV